MMKKTLFVGLMLLNLCGVVAQTPIVKPNLNIPSKIAPDYFGPNAFPIPDMLNGTTQSRVHLTLAADYFDGYRGDKTADIYLKLVVPLFSDRVNVSLWLNSVVEWYWMSAESHAHNRLPSNIALDGHEFGDAYLSTDIHLLRQQDYPIDLSLRIALKSALGYGYFKARYYDTPGYFFDTTAAKSLHFSGVFFKELRLGVSGGFLCWQTDNGRQNDAVMYGLQAQLSTQLFTLTESYGGYVGWEGDGDQPMSLKSELRFHLNSPIEPILYQQYGLQDYPFSQWRIGAAYRF